MRLYADTSALAKLVLDESGSRQMRAAVDDSIVVASVSIAYAELRATIARAAREGRLPGENRSRARVLVDALWERISEVPVHAALIRHAGDLADEHALRGYDALHLAGLIAFAAPSDASLACWDEDLGAAGRALGYAVVGYAPGAPARRA